VHVGKPERSGRILCPCTCEAGGGAGAGRDGGGEEMKKWEATKTGKRKFKRRGK